MQFSINVLISGCQCHRRLQHIYRQPFWRITYICEVIRYCGFGRRCSCSSSVTRHQRHRRQESSDTSLRSVTEEDYRAGLLRYEYVLFTLQYMPYCIYFNISYLYIISLILLNCRSICLCFVCYLCPDRREGDNKRCFCLSVRLSVCPSVVYIANNSRT